MSEPALRAWRGPGPGRPAVPVPPAPMRMWRGGRPLKRWTWVGAFSAELMLCAAVARVGPATTSWWAVWDGQTLQGRTARHARGTNVSAERVRVDGVLELQLGDAAPVEVISPHGAQHAWTRKRGGLGVRGMVLGRPFEARGILDESAGYHARRTSWRWCAGVGTVASGARVAWNLVDGLHDGPEASERTVWVDGEPRPLGPVAFDGLAGVRFGEGGALVFTAEATRARRDRLLVVSSDYEQPFGSFAGELTGAGPLRGGWGVMERHDVRW